MARRSFIVFLLFVAGGVSTLSAADKTSFGLGVGALYNGLGWNLALIKADGRITLSVAREALKLLEVDDGGLDEMDRRLLDALIRKYDGGPVGLNTLAVVVGEEPGTLEDVYEPFLIMEGFIKRTTRGREATDRAYEHLGLKPPKKSGEAGQAELGLG